MKSPAELEEERVECAEWLHTLGCKSCHSTSHKCEPIVCISQQKDCVDVMG